MLDGNSMYNMLISLLFKKVLVSDDFHEQAIAVQKLIRKDSTGMVDALTQFQVDSATVDVSIDTDNNKLNGIFEEWLENINSEFRGKGINVGIKGLMQEYYHERWRGASFPVLKITKWDKIGEMNFPVSMVFIDGGSINADKKKESDEMDMFAYDYYIGKIKTGEKIKGEAYLMYKLFCRSFAKYPTPYLVRRGVYKNATIIDMIKDKEIELIDGIIPYMMLVKKGSDALTQQGITYDTPDLIAIKEKIQELSNKLNDVQLDINGKNSKTPIRVTNYDEEINHLVPNLEAMFKRELFEQAERNILFGLGFIDVLESVSSSRRESVLNPRVFIEQCNAGVSDFVNYVLGDLLALVREKNKASKKYVAKKWIPNHKPIISFMGEEFLTLIRSMSDRGLISNETADYICSKGTINYEIEKRKRIREMVDGDEVIMYPKLIQNTEDKGIDITGKKNETPEKVTKDDVSEDKKGIEKKNFNQSSLEEELIISMLDSESINEETVMTKSDRIMLLEQSRWIKKRTTVNYIRREQINPDKFESKVMKDGQSFSTIWLDKKEGIKVIIGKLKDESKTSVQSYLFEVKKWKTKEADKWLKQHRLKINSKIELIGSPYSNINQLPKSVRVLPLEGQKLWIEIFNKSFSKGEGYARKVAWVTIKEHYRKGILGKWSAK